MLTTDTRRRLALALTSESAATEVDNLLLSYPGGTDYFVDPFFGSAVNDGKAPGLGRAFSTLALALAAVVTGDRIWIRGNIREEALICSNLVFDVKIIGVGGLHHPDQPTSAYDPGASMIRPPASPTAATPLINVRGRGWQFINIAFDCPVDAAAVVLRRNALATTAEYDASHTKFLRCRFVDGKYGIEDDGGCYNVVVQECEFKGMSTCAIRNTSTAVAVPLNWKIKDNHFHAATNGFGSAAHIAAPFDNSIIKNNTFGTVTSTGKYIDISGGNGGNIVTRNLLGGLYDTTDYVPGTGDIWYNNDTVVKATYSPDGQSITVPGA